MSETPAPGGEHAEELRQQTSGRQGRSHTAPAGIPKIISEGDSGRLKAPTGADLQVSIAEQQGDTLLLSLLIRAEAELSEVGDEPLLLEAASSRGLIRFHGQAHVEESGDVRFHLVDLPEVVQRRRFVRVFAPQPVALSSQRGIRAGAHTVNVSGGGMLLAGGEGLEIGDRVTFRLHLVPGDPPVSGSGRVVRVDEDGQLAVGFEDFHDEERERLIHFIFDRMRNARARTRDGGAI